MTIEYKGVAKEDLISSIREGMDFIASLNIGHATNAICQQWQGDEIYVPLRNARTNDELATAVKDSGATHAFAMLAKALEFHAEQDTIGQGKRVFDNIKKWDGDKGVRMMMLTDSDMEISDHIAAFSKQQGGFTARVQNEKRDMGNQQSR